MDERKYQIITQTIQEGNFRIVSFEKVMRSLPKQRLSDADYLTISFQDIEDAMTILCGYGAYTNVRNGVWRRNYGVTDKLPPVIEKIKGYKTRVPSRDGGGFEEAEILTPREEKINEILDVLEANGFIKTE